MRVDYDVVELKKGSCWCGISDIWRM